MEKFNKKPNPKSLMVLLAAIVLIGAAVVIANGLSSKNTKTSPSTKEVSNINKDTKTNSDSKEPAATDNPSSSTNDKNNSTTSNKETTAKQINMNQSITVNNLKYKVVNVVDIKELNLDKTNKSPKSNLVIITLEITNLGSKTKNYESPVFKLKNKSTNSSYGLNSIEDTYSNKELKELKPNVAVKRTLVFETAKKSTDDTYTLQCSGGVFSNQSIDVVLK